MLIRLTFEYKYQKIPKMKNYIVIVHTYSTTAIANFVNFFEVF